MEMLLLLNTLKEQQIRILLGRTSIGTQPESTDGNPMPMLETQIGFITVNFKLGDFILINTTLTNIKCSIK
jgi:hypothetical protein